MTEKKKVPILSESARGLEKGVIATWAFVGGEKPAHTICEMWKLKGHLCASLLQVMAFKGSSMQRIIQVVHRMAQEGCRQAFQLFCCPVGTMLREKAQWTCCPGKIHFCSIHWMMATSNIVLIIVYVAVMSSARVCVFGQRICLYYLTVSALLLTDFLLFILSKNITSPLSLSLKVKTIRLQRLKLHKVSLCHISVSFFILSSSLFCFFLCCCYFAYILSEILHLTAHIAHVCDKHAGAFSIVLCSSLVQTYFLFTIRMTWTKSTK